MPIKITAADWRAILPRAPQAVVDAFVAKMDVLDRAGITATKTRLAYFLANIEHECGGFTIPKLTESLAYTAVRMAEVWSNRFNRGKDARGNYIPDAGKVQARYGTGAGWQTKAFDDIYGSRMGNRPGTSDGSTYIGRGGPQWTGRDGYAALERITGLPAVADPAVAARLDMQPEICAAFWTWKGLNRFADAGDFVGCVKVWNGGTNGLKDRQSLMAGNDPILKRLGALDAVAVILPPTPVPAAGDVRWVQQALNRLGARLEVNGVAGQRTTAALKAFQVAQSLTADGIVGPATTAAINMALAQEATPAPAIPGSGPIVVPDITVPPAGTVKPGLASTFWGRVVDLFKPKA